MTKARLEAFSDGVIAIIITIMVLELKVPHGITINDLLPLLPVFLSYILSFIYVGIYWGNHHHLLHTVHHVNSKIIWANMHLLFWLSLIPFTTAYMGENHFENLPVTLYGINLILCAIAYTVLHRTIIAHYKHTTKLNTALQKQGVKGNVSLLCYSVAIVMSFYYPLVSALLFAFVAVLWIIPDKNIEKALEE
jgi:uncharacterized membrane protein